MSVRRSTLTATLVVALLCAAVAAHQVFDGSVGHTPSLPGLPTAQLPASLEPCPDFSPARLNGTVWTREKELLLASNDVVRFLACGSGELRVSARGSSVVGVGSYMVVSGLGGNLWEGEVTDEVALTIAVPTAGWIGVAFLNDKIQPPEDRNLWLEALDFRLAPAAGEH